MYDELAMIETERREDREGPGPRLWDADPGVCCAAYQLGACDHTEAQVSEFYAELDAEWRRDFPEEAAASDAAHEAWLAEQATKAAADAAGEEPF